VRHPAPFQVATRHRSPRVGFDRVEQLKM
jgi:hypothetical protein